MGLLAEIGASFNPQEYPRLSNLRWARTAGMLFLMCLLIVVAMGVRGAEAFAALRAAAGEWLAQLPEMVVYRGTLSVDTGGPVFIEGPEALLVIDPGDVLDLGELAANYETFVALRRTEIVAGGRRTALTGRPYPQTDRPFTTADLRLLAQRTLGLIPVIVLAGGGILWAWLGAAQLLWATVLAAVAYAVTSGARPRPSYSRLWVLSGHALVPVIAFSALNALFRFKQGTLGLGWIGLGTAVVFCALGVSALLREQTRTPGQPQAGPGRPAGPPGPQGPEAEKKPPVPPVL